MPAYQLRLEKERSLMDFIDSIADEVWAQAFECFDPGRIRPDDLERFREEAKISLQPYLSAYDLCGTFPECAEEVEGRPWLDYEDRIYFLNLSCTFPQFIEGLSARSLESIRPLIKPKCTALVYETIQESFRRHLAQHLYYNPACRRIEVCRESRPVHHRMFFSV